MYADKIVSVEEVGFIEVYDIEMNSDFHNYSANGIIVHNCNYGKDKFDNELKFIKPCHINEDTEEYKLWYNCLEDIEEAYLNMSKLGCTPDQMRMILPHSVASQYTMTANIREWRHILDLRTKAMTHPSIRQILIPLLLKFKVDMPELFDSIEYDTNFDQSKYAKVIDM